MRQAGVPHIAVVAMHGETSPEIEDLADSVDWVYVGQLRRTIRSLKRHNAAHVIFAGQIKPGRLFKGMRPDLKTFLLLRRLRERNAETIFSAIADEFEKAGIHVLSSTTFMRDALAPEGVVGACRPGRRQMQEIEFGAHIARESSRLDIGQTVVVKRGTVLAVEGFEGTDSAIRRGGELGRGNVTVVKVAKPGHDMRFDVPCIGMRTVESLREAGARTLAVQAGKTLFIERGKVIPALDRLRIAVVGIAFDELSSTDSKPTVERPDMEDNR